MTGTTISGVHLSSVTLSNAATENPATVASGAAITAAGIALLGEAGTVWTLTNYGVVLGTGTGSAGVALMGGGTISNTSTGSIAGATDAVYVNGGPGIVTNAGSISGTDTATPASLCSPAVRSPISRSGKSAAVRPRAWVFISPMAVRSTTSRMPRLPAMLASTPREPLPPS